MEFIIVFGGERVYRTTAAFSGSFLVYRYNRKQKFRKCEKDQIFFFFFFQPCDHDFQSLFLYNLNSRVDGTLSVTNCQRAEEN